MRISVVIPTYKEVLNIPLVADSVKHALGNADYEIVFVDDNSDDGSVEAVQSIAESHNARIVVRTEERGLSTAVIAGILEAKGDYVVVMDADLSHPATAIPGMVERIASNESDFCVGSRYIEGGSMDETWGWFRLLNSKIATWLALPLVHIKDPMSGFFCFERAKMPDAKILSPLGYKIGLEIMVKGGFSNASEYPIHFEDRQHGESKLNWKEQVLYLRHLRRLYHYRYTVAVEFIQFGAVGASGFIIDVILYLLLQTLFGITHTMARGFSFWGAASWNWFFNRTITFSHREKTAKFKQWASFIGTALMGFVMNWGSYKVLTENVPPFTDESMRIPALMIGVLMGMGFNFMVSRALVFKPAEKDL